MSTAVSERSFQVDNDLPVNSPLLTPLLEMSGERSGSTPVSTRMPVAGSKLSVTTILKIVVAQVGLYVAVEPITLNTLFCMAPVTARFALS